MAAATAKVTFLFFAAALLREAGAECLTTIDEDALLQLTDRSELFPPRNSSTAATEQHCAVLRQTYLESDQCGNRGESPASGFLVTGTGRSGTKFLVHLLEDLGFQVSHDTNTSRGWDGAVSWVHGNHKRKCALPWWSYNITESYFREVYLMLREPLAQISSRSENGGLIAREWYDFLSCSSHMAFHQVQGEDGQSFVSQSSSDGVHRSLETALKFYVLQNSFIEEYAVSSFRVEALKDDPQVIMDICSRHHGNNCTRARVSEVMNDLGTSVNSEHTMKTPDVTWSRLASIDRNFTAMAQALAQRHGYVIPREDLLPEAAFGYWCGFDGPDETTSRWTCMLKSRGGGAGNTSA